MDNDNSELSNYLIERTIDLFRIAQNMQISEKTLIFIMTLFTTVGTYCCKQIKYQTYLNKILNALKNEEYIRIKTAIELRTNENTMWDKLYDNRTKELTQKFLKELEKIKRKFSPFYFFNKLFPIHFFIYLAFVKRFLFIIFI